MLNQSGVKKETLANTVDILFANSASVSVGVVLTKGAKYPAGTPITGGTDGIIDKRAAGAYTKATGEAKLVGVLLHEVDCTEGAQNASICISGAFNVANFKDTFTADYTTALRATNNNLLFVE